MKLSVIIPVYNEEKPRLCLKVSRGCGWYFLIQDADLEYDPAQYPELIQPIIDGKYQVVDKWIFSFGLIRTKRIKIRNYSQRWMRAPTDAGWT